MTGYRLLRTDVANLTEEEIGRRLAACYRILIEARRRAQAAQANSTPGTTGNDTIEDAAWTKNASRPQTSS